VSIAPRNPLPGTEFLDAETGGQKSARNTANVHRDGKSGDDTSEIRAERASSEAPAKCAVWEDWMVETIWIELPAPHAGIEPVSETRPDVSKPPGPLGGFFVARGIQSL
jgi:hypothetical protein